MGLIDNIAQRQYVMTGAPVGSQPAMGPAFQVNGAASAGVGSTQTGFAMTLLVVLAGVLLAYAATRRIQGA